MSKIRQAVEYERLLSDAQVKAHTDLVAVQFDAERKLTEQAIAYERKYTDGQFGQLALVAEDHRQFHEREHLLYEDAIDKAAASLKSALDVLQSDIDRFREEATKWMTVERFEREHNNLTEKMELSIKTLSDKVVAEERVTLRQSTKDEVVASISQSAQSTRRWMVGLAISITGLFITVTLFGISTLLHVLGII